MENVSSKSIAHVICGNMSQHSAKTAVIVNNEELSYKEVDCIAGAILDNMTMRLQRKHSSYEGRMPGETRVGIYLPRDRYLVPAVWALVKGGFTYVPLDPETPFDRLSFMVKDCGVSAVVSEYDPHVLFGNIPNINVLSLAPGGKCAIRPCPDDARCITDTAYIIYTSGTTGKPKGVPVGQAGLFNLLQAVGLPEIFNISENSRLLCFSSISFDASIIEIFASLFHGSTLVMATERERHDLGLLVRLLLENKVSFMTLPPSMAVLVQKDDLKYLDTFVVAGEKMLSTIIGKHANQHYRLINAYGPTENTVMSTMRLYSTGMGEQNIGKPIPGVAAYVLHENLTPVSVGETGELHLGGVQLTSGYLNRPELNRKCFIGNPFPDQKEATVLYKTGDIVRLTDDGSFEFVGRKDSQVKFNGYRIELDEISKAIEQCSGVVQACVLVQTKEKGNSLVAFVKLAEKVSEWEKAIKEQLKAHLPHYMLPSSWIEVASFPRNINGKIDMRRLSEYKLKGKETASAGADNAENIMARVVEHILEQSPIDIDSDLFDDAGMTSLQVMQLPGELEVFGIYVSVEDIYRNRSIRNIISNRSAELHYWFNEPLPHKPVLVIVCGYTSFRFLYSELAKSVSPYYSVFVFESYHEYPEILTRSCNELVRYYDKVLISIAAGREISVIAGFCLGGELGLLLANELSKHSSLTPHVVVLDGEVSRSKTENENIPLNMDCLSDSINEIRYKRDMAIVSTMPDFRYKGKVTSILSGRFMSELSPFSKKTRPTQKQIECARLFYERTPVMWKQYYPDCRLFYVDADHWSYLRTRESMDPIVDYLLSLVEHRNDMQP